MIYQLKGNWQDRSAALKEIKGNCKGYAHHTISSDMPDGEVLRISTSAGIFDDKMLLVFEYIPKIKKFYEFVMKIHATGVYTIVFNDCDIRGKAILDYIKKHGEILNYQKTITIDSSFDYVKKFLVVKHEKKIKDETIQNIVNHIFGDFAEIDKSQMILYLDKVLCLIGSKKTIKEELIPSISTYAGELVIWDLYRYIDSQEYEKAWSFIEKTVNQSKYHEHECVMLVTGMIWRYRLLYLANSVYSKERKQALVPELLCELKKMERSGRGKKTILAQTDKYLYSEKMVNSLFYGFNGNRSAMECYTLNKLTSINLMLQDFIKKCRVGICDSERMLTLNILIMTICDRVDLNMRFFKSRLNSG